jgi:hypothetical protein
MVSPSRRVTSKSFSSVAALTIFCFTNANIDPGIISNEDLIDANNLSLGIAANLLGVSKLLYIESLIQKGL